MIAIEELRWLVDGRDVTCWNCRVPVYEMREHGLCPACYHALCEDYVQVSEHQMSQTSGVNPTLYTNTKKTPKGKGGKKGC